jgi:hypothetical protein
VIEHYSAPVDPRRSWQAVHPLPELRPLTAAAEADGLKTGRYRGGLDGGDLRAVVTQAA